LVERLEASFGTIRGLRTIELGSGRGDLSTLLAERGAEVTLVDSSEKALTQARHRFDRLGLDARFVCADFLHEAARWRGGFDVALSSGVIEHFEGADRTTVVRAHCDALAPGGLAVISVPNAWCLPYRVWKFHLEHRGWWPYGLELPYSRPELLRRMRLAGFGRVEGVCMGLWQSVGDHWAKRWLRDKPDWSRYRSVLDGLMGLILLGFGWRSE
jgi:SAM-dependent methyltransferase